MRITGPTATRRDLEESTPRTGPNFSRAAKSETVQVHRHLDANPDRCLFQHRELQRPAAGSRPRSSRCCQTLTSAFSRTLFDTLAIRLSWPPSCLKCDHPLLASPLPSRRPKLFLRRMDNIHRYRSYREGVIAEITGLASKSGKCRRSTERSHRKHRGRLGVQRCRPSHHRGSGNGVQ